MTQDGSHGYTYDAEGNILAVDGGSTAKYTYDALNRRVRVVAGGADTVYVFDAAGRRVAAGNALVAGGTIGGVYYWGARPLAYYTTSPAETHFEHQDYLGNERVRTSYAGAVEGTFAALPFGDGAASSGADTDPHHFAGLDHDAESSTEHAQFRNYSSAQGRWLAPDPYDGSYDPSDPQSFNRYLYVENNPLTFTDPSGKDGEGATLCAAGPVACAVGLGIEALTDWGLYSFFKGPTFHGTLHPRPVGTGTPDWGNDPGSFGESLGIPKNIKLTTSIADALGLPVAGCEFGACGGEMGFGPEDHHIFPQQFRDFFEQNGIDIDDYLLPLSAAVHRLKPGGIHTKAGGNWNGAWKQWIEDHPNAKRWLGKTEHRGRWGISSDLA